MASDCHLRTRPHNITRLGSPTLEYAIVTEYISAVLLVVRSGMRWHVFRSHRT